MQLMYFSFHCRHVLTFLCGVRGHNVLCVVVEETALVIGSALMESEEKLDV